MGNKIKEFYNCDCLELMKDIPDNSIDLVVTDPPYLVNYKTNHRKDKKHKFTNTIQNDDNKEAVSNYIKECYRIMKDNTAMYLFCNSNKVDWFKQELEKYFKVKNIIVWVKNNWTAGDLKGAFGKQYEFIFLVNKGRKEINGKRITDVWNFDRVSGKKQLHQNEKPLELIKQCIEKHSDEGEIVFDGFAGVATTMLAAKELERNYIGCELDKEYYDLGLKRLNNKNN